MSARSLTLRLAGPLLALSLVGPASAAPPPSADTANDRATFGIGPATRGQADPRGFFSYQTGPGGSYRDQASVVNYGTKPLRLQLYVSDLGSGQNGTVVAGLPTDPLNDAGRWVSIPVSQKSVVVPARGTSGPGRVIVPFTLSVPPTASPGDHGAALVAVLSSLGKNPSGQNVRLDQRVASRVYIRVRGLARPELKVLNLTASYHAGRLPWSMGHVTVSYTVLNVGNVRLGADQVVTASTPFSGGHRGRPAPVAVLFPGGRELVTVEIGGILPTVLGKAKVVVTPRLFTDQPQQSVVPVTASTRFYAVPWLLLAILALLVVALIVRRWLRKRRPVGAHEAGRGAAGRDPALSSGPVLRSRGPDVDHREPVIPTHDSGDPHVTRTSTCASLGCAAVTLLCTVLGGMVAAHADSVPFKDPDARGQLSLCDAYGHQLDHGSVYDKPFANIVVSSEPTKPGYDHNHAGKATLFAYTPVENVDPPDWVSFQLSGASFFSNDAHPMAEVTAKDYSLRDYAISYPRRWQGLVQLRFVLGSPGKPLVFTPYPAAVLKIDGDTWRVVQQGPDDCATGKAISTEKIYNKKAFPQASAGSVGVTVKPTDSPAPRSRPGSSPGPGGGSKASGATPGSSGGDTQSGGSTMAAGGGSEPSTASGLDKGGNGWLLALGGVLGAAILGTAAVLVRGRRRNAARS